MLAGVTPFGLHRLPVIYRAFGTACANCYIIAKSNPKITIQRIMFHKPFRALNREEILRICPLITSCNNSFWFSRVVRKEKYH